VAACCLVRVPTHRSATQDGAQNQNLKDDDGRLKDKLPNLLDTDVAALLTDVLIGADGVNRCAQAAMMERFLCRMSQHCHAFISFVRSIDFLSAVRQFAGSTWTETTEAFLPDDPKTRILLTHRGTADSTFMIKSALGLHGYALSMFILAAHLIVRYKCSMYDDAVNRSKTAEADVSGGQSGDIVRSGNQHENSDSNRMEWNGTSRSDFGR